MAVVTEKIFFKGTPAQFCAVVAEYELDTRAAAVAFSFQINEPTTVIIVPQDARHTHPNDDFGRLLDRATSGFVHREHVVALHPDSPRASISCYVGRRVFFVSALLCPDNRTQLTLRVESEELESIKNDWLSMVGYMGNLGWLEDSKPVKQAQLSEPEEWTKELLEMNITAQSVEWWTEIERRTRLHWQQKGRVSLPIKGRLDKALSVDRSTIYRNTSLNDSTADNIG